VRAGLILASMLREARGSRGRMLFFTACLAVGVAAVTGVDALIGAVEGGMRAQGRELLAADLRLGSNFKLPEDLGPRVLEKIEAAGMDPDGVEETRFRELVSMSSTGGAGEPGASHLVEVRAVGEGFPFYGELLTEPAGALTGLDDHGALIAPELLRRLELAPGDELWLGGAAFRIAGTVLSEPDQLEFSMTMGPRVLLTAAGLDRTNLVQFGSRIRYRALFKIPDATDDGMSLLRHILRYGLAEGRTIRVETTESAQENVANGIGRVGSFLGLVALLSLVLGGIGVAQIVRAWISARTPSVAVLRCLGYRPREILVTYLCQVALLAAVGSALGAALGALLPFAAPHLAPEFLSQESIRPWQPMAILRGLGLGVGIALVFAIPPLTAVWRVSPARVLRAEANPLPVPLAIRVGSRAVLLAGVFLAAWAQAKDLRFAAGFAGALALLTALLAGAAWLVTRLARRLPRRRLSPYLAHGLAALGRPGEGTAGSVVALGLGVLVVLQLFLVHTRLAGELETALPEDAPTAFFIDIQPDQWDGVRGLLETEQATGMTSAPVIMARLAQLDGVPVEEMLRRPEGRHIPRWVLTREQRLTWRDDLPASNQLVEGEWFTDPRANEVSIEEGYAEDLGLDLGSTIVLDVQGVPVELVVTSLREVEWRSFAINFFFIVEPSALEGAPHFRLAAARLGAAAEERVQDTLAASFPNVTMLRVRAILERVVGLLGQLARGVRALSGFTILVGIAVLAGAISSGSLRRGREAALLKALGVTRRGVVLLFAVEYALVGLVAGGIGSLGAFAGSWLFLEHVVDIEPSLPLAPLVYATLGSGLAATACGLGASARALATRPLATLRNAAGV
jgi:putative ABC transport system permease protein